MDKQISYDEFKLLIINDQKNCRNFKIFSFEYYECGAMGFGWCVYGFHSLHDLIRYWKYCINNI